MARGADTKKRIVGESIHLFAERGIRATTVADIERASGLKPGSGALFAHFPSKEAVVVAAIEDLANQRRVAEGLFDLARIGDLRSELTVFVRAALMGLEANRDLVRLWLKEADQLPDLKPLVERELNRPAADWIAN